MNQRNEVDPNRLCAIAQILLRAIVIQTIRRDGSSMELLDALQAVPAQECLCSLHEYEIEEGLRFLRRLGYIAPRSAELLPTMPIIRL